MKIRRSTDQSREEQENFYSQNIDCTVTDSTMAWVEDVLELPVIGKVKLFCVCFVFVFFVRLCVKTSRASAHERKSLLNGVRSQKSKPSHRTFFSTDNLSGHGVSAN